MLQPKIISKEERLKNLIEHLERMKPFKNMDDIPSPPKVDEEIYKSVVIPNYIRCGAIPKSALKDNCVYEGECRNASTAIWSEKNQKFTYIRHKFGSVYEEDINHFEDDDGYDLFVPLREKYKNPN